MQITAILGPMFSGKSTSLFEHMEKYVYAGKTIALIRPKKDNRDYFSHSFVDNKLNELISNKKIDFIPLEDLAESSTYLSNNYDVIFIDEYFMLKNCRKFIEDIEKYSGRCYHVYFAGLLADSDCKMWEQAIDIMPLCDNIIKLNGVCTCCGSMYGNVSYHKGDKDSRMEIGDNKYECLCNECYQRIIEK